jgi:murein tripeptide amidase MpaA
VHVSASFDSGNIEVIDTSNPADVRLAIRKDVGDEHMQWFHFRAVGVRGVACTFRLMNASKASYPAAWTGTRAVVSEDRQAWRRAETEYVDGVLVIRVTPAADTVEVAYFAPYSHDRHLDFVARCQASLRCRHDVLGQTLDGRDLDRLVVGQPGAGKRTVWVIGRQHPGETMASWWMEGFLGRLLDRDDPLARQLLERAVFHVVPHMNPDGGVRGHLRTNAAGTNLNRVWDEPTMETGPEVKLVRDAMDQTGVDLALDVHGDEELPYNFIMGAEGVPAWDDRHAALLDAFRSAYVSANPDFQTEKGYPVDRPNRANMSMCTNQTAQRYDALSMTLEMPFKDNANAPDAQFGWSPTRCRRLGASVLDPIVAVVNDLR